MKHHYLESILQLKVISRGEDGSWKGVSVSGGHRDKRLGKSAGSIYIKYCLDNDVSFS